jgi:hypothetical protein
LRWAQHSLNNHRVDRDLSLFGVDAEIREACKQIVIEAVNRLVTSQHLLAGLIMPFRLRAECVHETAEFVRALEPNMIAHLPFLGWRASLSDEQWADWGALEDNAWAAVVKRDFGMDVAL